MPAECRLLKNAPAFYERCAIATFVLLFLAISASSFAQSNIQTLRHTHYYDGIPITDFNPISTKLDLANGMFSACPSAIYDTRAYFSTDSGLIIDLSVNDQRPIDEEKSVFKLTGKITATPAVSEKNIIVGSSDKYVACFDRVSHILRWKFKTKAPVSASPLYINGLIIVGSDDGKCVALDAIGKTIWKFDAKAPPAAASYDDSVIYWGTNRGRVFAISIATGKLLWESNAGGRTVCIGDSLIYVVNQNGALVALQKSDGSERWRFDDEDYISQRAFELALAPNTLIYSADTKIVAFDPMTGKKLWDKPFNQPICGIPMIVSDVLYIPCSDFHLYGVDLSSGIKLAQADIGFAPYGSPSYADGKILYPSKKVLYIFSPK